MRLPICLWRAVAVLAAVVLLTVLGTGQAAIVDGLTTHWCFDRNFRSETNSLYNGTGLGNATITTTAGEFKFGAGGLKLDGTGDLVSVANEVIADGAGLFTIALWANMQGTGSGGTTRVIYSTSPSYASEISLRDGTATTGLTDWYQQGIVDYTANTTVINNNEWHHYAVSWNKPAGVLKYYLDGAKVFEQAGQGAKSPAATDGFRIGADRNSGRGFNGFIDDMAVWSRELSEAEVASLGSGGGTAIPLPARPAGLLAEYGFETAGGAGVSAGQSAVGRVDDTAASGGAGAPFHGTGSGGTLRYEVGAASLGHALVMTEATTPIDFVSLGMQPGMATLTEGDFSIETWFKTTDAGRGVLVGSYPGSTGNAVNLEYYNNGGNGQLRAYIQNVGTGGITDLFSSGHGTLNDGKWHHAAMVREGSTLQLYLDGGPVGSKTDAAGSCTLPPSTTMYLGRDSRTTSERFDGVLDDVRFWNKALGRGELSVRTAEQSYYRMETDAGSPVAPGQAAVTVDDKAAHPFVYNGTANGGASLQYSADVPTTIVGSDGQATTRSLSFDGSNDYVDLGNATLIKDLPQGPFTLQSWIKTVDTNRAVLFGSYNNVNRCVNFEIGSSSYGNGALRAYMEGDGGNVNLWGTKAVYDGQWHHVAMVYTGPGTSNVTLYVDGVADVTGTYTGNPYSIETPTVVLGRDPRTVGIPYYGGLMDEFHMAGTALAPKQFLLYGNGEQNYYRMETAGGIPVSGGQAAGVVDDTGLHPFTYNGTALPAGSPKYSTDVPAGGVVRDGAVVSNRSSLAFNGTSDYVELGDRLLLRTLTEDDFTIEFFAKTPARADRGIVVGSLAVDPGPGLNLDSMNLEIGGAEHGSNQGHMRVWFSKDDALNQFFGATDIADNQWHHLAVVRSGAGTANDQVQLYVDYHLDGQMDFTLGQFTIETSLFRLGRDERSTIFYQGLLDEFRITRQALSPSQFLMTVPEPASLALAALGVLGMVVLVRRRGATHGLRRTSGQ